VDLQATPTTTAVMMGSGMQRRERDIVAEQNVVPLSNSLSTMRLPLDACSTAAADAIEATGLGPTVPATFDLVCSGGGLIAFYGGAVSSVLGTLARRGVLRVGQLHGCSSGALICATYLGVEAGYTKLEDIYRCYHIFARARWLSPAMRQFLDECLPADIHERASGRMHITVTEIGHSLLPTRRTISKFATRDDLLDVIMASTIIPGITNPSLHRTPSGGLPRCCVSSWRPPRCCCLGIKTLMSRWHCRRSRTWFVYSREVRSCLLARWPSATRPCSHRCSCFSSRSMVDG